MTSGYLSAVPTSSSFAVSIPRFACETFNVYVFHTKYHSINKTNDRWSLNDRNVMTSNVLHQKFSQCTEKSHRNTLYNSTGN